MQSLATRRRFRYKLAFSARRGKKTRECERRGINRGFLMRSYESLRGGNYARREKLLLRLSLMRIKSSLHASCTFSAHEVPIKLRLRLLLHVVRVKKQHIYVCVLCITRGNKYRVAPIKERNLFSRSALRGNSVWRLNSIPTAGTNIACTMCNRQEIPVYLEEGFASNFVRCFIIVRSVNQPKSLSFWKKEGRNR